MEQLEPLLLERNLADTERRLVAVLPYFPGGIAEKLYRMESSVLLHIAAARVLVVGILLDEVLQKNSVFIVPYKNII